MEGVYISDDAGHFRGAEDEELDILHDKVVNFERQELVGCFASLVGSQLIVNSRFLIAIEHTPWYNLSQ